jgi:hypothetical protein
VAGAPSPAAALATMLTLAAVRALAGPSSVPAASRAGAGGASASSALTPRSTSSHVPRRIRYDAKICVTRATPPSLSERGPDRWPWVYTVSCRAECGTAHSLFLISGPRLISMYACKAGLTLVHVRQSSPRSALGVGGRRARRMAASGNSFTSTRRSGKANGTSAPAVR